MAPAISKPLATALVLACVWSFEASPFAGVQAEEHSKPVEGVHERARGQHGATRHKRHGFHERSREGEEGPEIEKEVAPWEEKPTLDGEEITPVDIGVTAMLFGSMGIVMIMFQLVNWPDDDIRRYSWNIISTTVSIFTAVLTFQGINQLLVVLAAEHGVSEHGMVLIHYAQFLFYFVVLQLTIGFISGVFWKYDSVDLAQEKWIVADMLRVDYEREIEECLVRSSQVGRSVAVIQGLEVYVQKVQLERLKRERAMKCYALVLAHMAGFAAINAGGTLQQQRMFSSSPGMTAVPVVFNEIFLIALFQCSRLIRSRAQTGRGGMSFKMFNDEVSEAENEISSLALSFLNLQTCRFYLTGVMPDVEGLEVPELPHDLVCIIGLYMCSAAFGVLTICLVILNTKKSYPEDSAIRPVVEMFMNTMAMSSAWGLMWATRWMLVGSHVLRRIGVKIHSMEGRVVLALLLSTLAFAMIFILDHVDDMAKSGQTVLSQERAETARMSMKTVITSLSILVGFSWEHCFEGGVTSIASLTKNPIFAKMFLGILVTIIILPAWRNYILTKAMLHMELQKEQELTQQEDVEMESRTRVLRRMIDEASLPNASGNWGDNGVSKNR